MIKIKLTMCRTCIQSGRLCNSCKAKQQEGKTGKYDADIGMAIIKTSKSHKYLQDITLYQIIETDKTVYMLMKRGDREKFLRAGAELIEKFEEIVRREVKYLEKIGDKKKILEVLFSPIVPLGHSTVLIPPEGDKELKIRLKKTDKDKLKFSATDLSQLTLAMMKMRCHYEFV